MVKQINSAAAKPGTPNPLEPASYGRRVLLAVCGLSPQVVTETLYALATAKATKHFMGIIVEVGNELLLFTIGDVDIYDHSNDNCR